MSSAGGSQKKGSGTEAVTGNAAIRIVPAKRYGGGTRPGWHKARFMCDKRCKKEDFKFFDIAAILVEGEGRPHTVNLCKMCCNF